MVKKVKVIADFHIHSHYSIATSKKLTPEYLDYWAAVKGIEIVGTGDCTHPGWLEECREKLIESGPGLYKLRPEYALRENTAIAVPRGSAEVRFIITGEISNIYKKDGKVRKVHNLVFLPGFEEAKRFQHELAKIGNITSDGRPILGLPARDLFEILLSISSRADLVPAHIWTPWFSVLGSKSGFDTLEQCYEDLTGEISAVETGLSSDPPMNWICSILDRFNIIFNSDAHSPEKLGREANLIDVESAYDSVLAAICSTKGDRFLGTIEFFPEEGKYHLDGHRKCGIAWDPAETRKNGGICPVCGKPVTVGVLNRVAELADRVDVDERSMRASYTCLVPLKELLSEIVGVGPNSVKVGNLYGRLARNLGTELNILLRLPVDQIRDKAGEFLAEGIKRMRERRVYIREGFDGEFGTVRVFGADELSSFGSRELLFSDIQKRAGPPPKRAILGFDLSAVWQDAACGTAPTVVETAEGPGSPNSGLNRQQLAAVRHRDGPAFVIAGPGTGKTNTLIHRIAYLVQELLVDPGEIIAVTFTNKAAEELKKRVKVLLGESSAGGSEGQAHGHGTMGCSKGKVGVSLPRCTTLHAFGLEILKNNLAATGRSPGFSILGGTDRDHLIKQALGEGVQESEGLKEIASIISTIKQSVGGEGKRNYLVQKYFAAYEDALVENNCFDLDDLIRLPVRVLREGTGPLSSAGKTINWMLVDEFQDINPGQYELIQTFCPPPDSNLFVIGDPDQSIYGFRGADRTAGSKFFKDYRNAARYYLSTSYRCPERFIQVSRQVVGKQKENLRGKAGDVTVQVVETETDKSEAEFIARSIEKMAGGIRFFSLDSNISDSGDESEISSLSEVAVLCRLKRQRTLIEKAFGDHAVPYQSIDMDPLFESGTVRQALDICRSVRNKRNIILRQYLSERYHLGKDFFGNLEKKLFNISDPEAYLSTVRKELEGETGEEDANFRKALRFAQTCGGDIDRFLYLAAMGNRAELYEKNIEGVSLLTIHAAKGLEFETVFIPGCEDGIMPFTILEGRNANLEEERRLLYVGMTRASKHLCITHARSRMLFGRRLKQGRSPFLDDIDTGLLDLSSSEYERKTNPADVKQLDLF